MKLCMPTEDGAGLGGRLSSHFGRAPFFTVVASDTGQAEVVANGRAHHEHGQCGGAMAAFEGRGVEAVVCRGVGRRALDGMQQRGLPIFLTDAATVAEALQAFREGRLTQANLDEVCVGGHEHGHG
jgi:predicted Fe-Mo cluster-binding NifX family protein